MSILTIQFPQNFEERYQSYKKKVLDIATPAIPHPKIEAPPTPKNKVLTVQLTQGLLTLNESTGLVQFNEVKTNINPQGKEFAVLRTLMSSDDYLATYTDLLGEKPSKDAKRRLGFIIRNIKELLGILPRDGAKNPDCIENITGHGYKLITEHNQGTSIP